MAKKEKQAEVVSANYAISDSGEVVDIKEQEQKEYEAKVAAEKNAKPTKFTSSKKAQAEDTKIKLAANRKSLSKTLGIDIPEGFTATIDATSKEWKPAELTALANAGFVLSSNPGGIDQKYIKGLDSASNARIDVKAKKYWKDPEYIQGPLLNPEKQGKEGFVLKRRAWVPATPIGEIVWNNNTRADGQLWHPDNKINMAMRDAGLGRIYLAGMKGSVIPEELNTPAGNKLKQLLLFQNAKEREANEKDVITFSEANKNYNKNLRSEANYVKNVIDSGTFPSVFPKNYENFGISAETLGIDNVSIDTANEIAKKLKLQNKDYNSFFGKLTKINASSNYKDAKPGEKIIRTPVMYKDTMVNDKGINEVYGKAQYAPQDAYKLTDDEDALTLNVWEKYYEALNNQISSLDNYHVGKQINQSFVDTTTWGSMSDVEIMREMSGLNPNDKEGKPTVSSYGAGISKEDDLDPNSNKTMGIKEPAYFVTKGQLFAPVANHRIKPTSEEGRFDIKSNKILTDNNGYPKYAGNLQFDSSKLPLLPLTQNRENLNRQLIDDYASKIISAIEKGNVGIKNVSELKVALNNFAIKKQEAESKKLKKAEKAEKTIKIQQYQQREEDAAHKWIEAEEKRRGLKPGSLGMSDYTRWKQEQNEAGK